MFIFEPYSSNLFVETELYMEELKPKSLNFLEEIVQEGIASGPAEQMLSAVRRTVFARDEGQARNLGTTAGAFGVYDGLIY